MTIGDGEMQKDIVRNSKEIHWGFPSGKKSPTNAGDLGSIPELGRSPGGRHGNSLQYFCLENPHEQRGLAGYSPWGCKELDSTERLGTAKQYPSSIKYLKTKA